MNQDQMKQEVKIIENDNGFKLAVMNYGARLVGFWVPVKKNQRNIVLGYPRLEDYLSDPFYMGASIGRYANRISQSQFCIGNQRYLLNANEGKNQLHGGEGYDKRFWEFCDTNSNNEIKLELFDADGDQGYPGAVLVTVSYQLTAFGLHITYLAETSLPTWINLTHHSYFNLSPNGGSALDHTLQIFASRFLPVDEFCLPGSPPTKVHNTAFDFRSPVSIRDRLLYGDEQNIICKGYDHTFCIDENINQNCRSPNTSSKVAILSDSENESEMTVFSNQPSLQLYTGNHLHGKFAQYAGICLEPQLFPNTPNVATFPGKLTMPGQRYRNEIRYEFCSN